MALNQEDLQEYTLKDFRLHLSQIVGEVAHGQKRIRITAYGKTAGYFISEEELTYLDTIEEAHTQQELNRILSISDSTTVPSESSNKSWWNQQIDIGMTQAQKGDLISGEKAYARIQAKIDKRKAKLHES